MEVSINILIFHLFKVLQTKFDDLKHRIEIGAERFNQCDEFAKKLIGTDSPYVADVEKRQEHLR